MPLLDIDRRLIERCLRKEPGAWNDFVDRYMGLIYHVIEHAAHARSVRLTPADIEDVCAEVFLALVDDDYATLRRFQARSSLPTYLTVVARRVCVKELVKRRREAELGHVTVSRAVMNENDSSAEIEPIATAEEVQRMIAGLPDREAEIVRLYHLRYLSYRQIGKQIGVPENSVGPILARARRRLRQMAEQRGGN